MTEENQIEFIKTLFEHRDKNNEVKIKIKDKVYVLEINPYLEIIRSIDSQLQARFLLTIVPTGR